MNSFLIFLFVLTYCSQLDAAEEHPAKRLRKEESQTFTPRYNRYAITRSERGFLYPLISSGQRGFLYPLISSGRRSRLYRETEMSEQNRKRKAVDYFVEKDEKNKKGRIDPIIRKRKAEKYKQSDCAKLARWEDDTLFLANRVVHEMTALLAQMEITQAREKKLAIARRNLAISTVRVHQRKFEQLGLNVPAQAPLVDPVH